MCLPGIILALWCIEMNKTQLALPWWNLHSLEKKINRLIICQVVISPLRKMEDYKAVKVTQLCPTLCNPIDYTVHGILQARILEWVAFPFSRGSNPGLPHCRQILYQLSHKAVGDGQGSLACCSPWGHKESDTTEQLNWTDIFKNLFIYYSHKYMS